MVDRYRPGHVFRYRARRGAGSGGTFKKGKGDEKDSRTNNAGRPPGSVNRLPKIVREITLEAIERLGSDNKGKDGAVGWLMKTFKKKPEHAIQLLIRILPLQVTGSDGGPVRFQTVPAEYFRDAPDDELAAFDRLCARLRGNAPRQLRQQKGDAAAYAKEINVELVN